jgi:hypothetical protein
VLCTFVDDADCCCKYYATLSLMLFGCNSVLLKISDDKITDTRGAEGKNIVVNKNLSYELHTRHEMFTAFLPDQMKMNLSAYVTNKKCLKRMLTL